MAAGCSRSTPPLLPASRVLLLAQRHSYAFLIDEFPSNFNIWAEDEYHCKPALAAHEVSPSFVSFASAAPTCSARGNISHTFPPGLLLGFLRITFYFVYRSSLLDWFMILLPSQTEGNRYCHQPQLPSLYQEPQSTIPPLSEADLFRRSPTEQFVSSRTHQE